MHVCMNVVKEREVRPCKALPHCLPVTPLGDVLILILVHLMGERDGFKRYVRLEVDRPDASPFLYIPSQLGPFSLPPR